MSTDHSAGFIEQIRAAAAHQQRLQIKGHGSKAEWLPLASGNDVLELSSHTGILQYEPEELVLTARGGTSLADIDAVLAGRQQMIACEPPQLLSGNVSQATGNDALGSGTLGGAVACGLSGPSKPKLGTIRDAEHGVEQKNGERE